MGLDKILEEPNIIDTIIVSSIHFGNNTDGTPYIHLNDLNPDDKKFDILWNQTKILVTEHNKEIILMLGGAVDSCFLTFSTEEFVIIFSVCFIIFYNESRPKEIHLLGRGI